jgi:hypothetical protein
MEQKSVNTMEWRVEWHKAKRRECWRAMHDSTRKHDSRRNRSRSRKRNSSKVERINQTKTASKYTSSQTATTSNDTSSETKLAPTDASSSTKTTSLEKIRIAPTSLTTLETTTNNATTETVSSLVATPRIDVRARYKDRIRKKARVEEETEVSFITLGHSPKPLQNDIHYLRVDP